MTSIITTSNILLLLEVAFLGWVAFQVGGLGGIACKILSIQGWQGRSTLKEVKWLFLETCRIQLTEYFIASLVGIVCISVAILSLAVFPAMVVTACMSACAVIGLVAMLSAIRAIKLNGDRL